MAFLLKVGLACALGAALVAAGMLAWSIRAEYLSIPVSDKGAAYTLAVNHALTSDSVRAIWAGKTPNIVFRYSQFDANSKYLWEPAKLTRPDACLDVTRADGTKLTLPDQCRTAFQFEPSEERFFFKIDADRSISIGINQKTPVNGRIEGRGAMYGVEGEIKVGRSLKKANSVKIEMSAAGLNIADLSAKPDPNVEAEREGDQELGGCDAPREVQLEGSYVYRLLPRTVARLCRFRFEGGSAFKVVQYQSGLMQYTRWTDALMCRSLLGTLLGQESKRGIVTGIAGCIGAHWNEIGSTDVSIVLFEMTLQRKLAQIR